MRLFILFCQNSPEEISKKGRRYYLAYNEMFTTQRDRNKTIRPGALNI